MKLKKLLILSIIGFVSFSSCKKDDPVTPVIPNEEEVITTLIYTLTDTANNTIILTYRDLDGEGSNAPVISNGTLNASSVYSGSIVLLNETDTNDVENITLEILEEDEDHQFFFVPTASGLTVTYNDSDSLGNPIGLITNLNTGLARTGNLTITLKHEPNKDGVGVEEGDMTNAGGETDIEVVFPISVQ